MHNIEACMHVIPETRELELTDITVGFSFVVVMVCTLMGEIEMSQNTEVSFIGVLHHTLL